MVLKINLGAKTEKMSSKRLHELLAEIADNELDQQERQLKSYFYEWKKNLSQVDDVCIMGFRM